MSRFLIIALLSLSIGGCESTEKTEPPIEHAVLVYFDNYGSTDLGRLFELEDKIEMALTAAGVGKYDGNEIRVDGSDGTLFMYGPNADSIYEVIRPILISTDFTKNALVILRYGPPEEGVPRKEIRLGT